MKIGNQKTSIITRVQEAGIWMSERTGLINGSSALKSENLGLGGKQRSFEAPFQAGKRWILRLGEREGRPC